MPNPLNRALSTLVAALAAIVVTALPARAHDPTRIGWTELDYEASKLGFEVESRLEMRRMPVAEMRAALVDPGPGDWLPAPETGGWLVRLTTEGLGRRSELELILEASGRSLQRTQIETGRRLKDHRNRTHRFAPAAVHVGTLKPTREEVGRPALEWSVRSDWLESLPAATGGEVVLGQATGLFYTLGAADLLEPGDRVTAHVLSKGKVMAVDLVVEGREPVDIDLVEVSERGERRRRERLDALRIRLTGRGLGDDAEASDFRFLGMRGEVEVLLDPVTRAPVEISGRVGWLGRARVRLERLVLGRH